MDKTQLIGNAVGLVLFILWISNMISWIRRGVSIPRYIHLLATVLTSISIGCLIGMAFSGLITLKFALGFVLIPPVATYLGWFWLGGPEFGNTGKH